MNILKDWPHDWYGMWNFGDEPSADVPRIEEAIDELWLPADKTKLIEFLESATTVAAFGYLGNKCQLCDAPVPLAHESDGIWVWASDLAHYVREHNVVIPDRWANRIRGCGYVPPKLYECNYRSLPWFNRAQLS